MIFQHFNLLNSKTVFENVAIPLELGGVHKTIIETQVREVLTFVGLEDKVNRYIDELSGDKSNGLGLREHLSPSQAYYCVMKRHLRWIHKRLNLF